MSSGRAVRHVRVVVLVSTSLGFNNSAEIHVFFDVEKQLDSLDSDLFFLRMPKLMVTFRLFNELPVRKFNGKFSSKKRGCK